MKKRRNCRRKGWPKCTMMGEEEKKKKDRGETTSRREKEELICMSDATAHPDKRGGGGRRHPFGGRMKRRGCRALEVSFSRGCRVSLTKSHCCVDSKFFFDRLPSSFLFFLFFFSQRNTNPSRRSLTATVSRPNLSLAGYIKNEFKAISKVCVAN